MKRTATALIIICLANTLAGQAPLVKQWDKLFGGSRDDDITSFQQTSDGGYILGGMSNSSVSGDRTQVNWDTSNGAWVERDW